MAGTSEVLFASAVPERVGREYTLPALFKALLERMPIRERVDGRTVAVKMHLGGGIGYSTIHPLFVKLLIEHIRQGHPRRVFVTDGSVEGAADRGYTEETVGAPLVPAAGRDGRDVVARRTGWKPLKTALLGRPLLEADVLVNFAHVKGHGDCGFGGACKNLAMGCVPGKTRGRLHSLEGDLKWRKARCVHCNRCIKECPTGAAQFNPQGEFTVFWHHCRMCQHCMLICPANAIRLTNRNFNRFQEGLARVARLVLNQFDSGMVFHINMLTNVTIFCDCWGLTTPALVPDIGVMASEDIVAVETASLRAVKTRNVIPGSVTPPYVLGKGRHLFEKLHHRDPFAQVRALEKLGAGASRYRLIPLRAAPAGGAAGH